MLSSPGSSMTIPQDCPEFLSADEAYMPVGRVESITGALDRLYEFGKPTSIDAAAFNCWRAPLTVRAISYEPYQRNGYPGWYYVDDIVVYPLAK
jgi:hypothetical protein